MLDREMSSKETKKANTDDIVAAEFHEVEASIDEKDDIDRYLDDNLK